VHFDAPSPRLGDVENGAGYASDALETRARSF
jgi:hypothetical protein